MNLSVAVMAHPDREHFVDELLPDLPGAKVVWDERGDRWDTGKRAMLAHEPDSDWGLVVQDDALLCKDFLPGVREALSHAPTLPVSFYTGRTRPYGPEVARAVRRARAARKNWLVMRGPIWGVAIALPRELIAPMVRACDRLPDPNYDRRMMEHFHGRGIECWYTLPSLVDHRVGEANPSLVPGRGAGLGRVAHEFCQGSALDIDWSTGAYRAGDPSEPWRPAGERGYACTRCAHAGTLPEAITHYLTEHDGGGRVDLLASTSTSTQVLSGLHAEIPKHLRGALWLVGGDLSRHASTKHRSVTRAEAARAIATYAPVFTVCAARRDLRLLGDRAGWSLDGYAN